MLLNTIQDRLATLYETPMEHAVMDFLITDATLAAALETNPNQRENRERVLLRQTNDSLDISVYIDHDIMQSLTNADPFAQLGSHNLNDYLVALEGVSHFNYIVWNACHERQVSQLELELQAEVDKFISAMMLLDNQGSSQAAQHFHHALFDNVIFDQSAHEEDIARYRAANRYAAKYCRSLNQRYGGQHQEPSFVNEVRRFYRLSQRQKIQLIDNG